MWGQVVSIAVQAALLQTPATLLTAFDNREQTQNFLRAEQIGGAVVCHRKAHRNGAGDSRPSESDQWVAFLGGVFQGVWYHREQFETFIRVRGWELIS